MIVFALLAWATWHFGYGWVSAHMTAGGHGFLMRWLGYLIGGLIVAVLGLVVVFCFVPLATLIATPFNDILSEKVERIYTGHAVDLPFSLRRMLRTMGVGMHSSLRLTLLSMMLLLLALPLNLIPGVGSALWTAASAAITIRFLALQFTAYSMDRRLFSYQQRHAFMRRHRARTIGLGTMAFLVMMLPILNALFIPISAVAGTLLFCDTQAE